MGVRIEIAVLLTLLLVSTPTLCTSVTQPGTHDVPIPVLLLAAVLQATWLKQDARPGWWLLPIGVLIGVRSSSMLTFPVFAVAVLVGLGWRTARWLARVGLAGESHVDRGRRIGAAVAPVASVTRLRSAEYRSIRSLAQTLRLPTVSR